MTDAYGLDEIKALHESAGHFVKTTKKLNVKAYQGSRIFKEAEKREEKQKQEEAITWGIENIDKIVKFDLYERN